MRTMTILLSKIKLKLICFATFILMQQASAQKTDKIIRMIARKTNNETTDIEMIEVVRHIRKRSKHEYRALVNAQIGMPSGFGRGAFQVPDDTVTEYYAIYKLHGTRYHWLLNEKFKPIWKKQQIL